MSLRIEGRDLPGLPGIVVAVQVRDKPKELLDPVRGDAAGTLRARMGLTNAKGQPRTARVLPPEVEWTAS